MAEDRRRDEASGETNVRFSWAAVRETPRYTYLVSAIAAIGGMLFGYDIGVISGAENLLKSAFQLSSGTEELAVAAVLIGAVIGGLFGGPLANRISRRYTLLTMAVLYGIGAILTSISWDLGSFLAFRILTGIAVGASSLVVPIYIAELAPVSIRGGLVILQQLAISFGILVSYVLDFAFDSAGWGWRPMFAAAVVPAVVLAAGMLKMSHSPRWLAMQGRWDDADAVVERIDPQHKEQEMELLHSNVEESSGTSWRQLLRPGLRGALIAGAGLAVFQQFVGPNTVLFDTPTIFGYAGVTGNPLLPTMYVGAVLFVFVFPAIAVVDIIGRKKRRGVPEPAARGRRQRRYGLQLEREPAHHRHVPVADRRRRQALDVLDLRDLRRPGHHLRLALRA
jgi:SP family galactose:H+ symporter-like MFS transporter